MTAQKQAGYLASARSITATTAATTTQATRKPWKKKTPVEVVLDQINRLRDDVLEREEELKQAKRQLQKLEEAKKVLEAT
jgi:predicted patatin/cPLA2 family phospholipase